MLPGVHRGGNRPDYAAHRSGYRRESDAGSVSAHAVEQVHGRGIVVGADAGFFFADGSRRSPDAAWFERIAGGKSQKKGTRFPRFAPEFVIEVRSPEQRARPLREKMEEYIANGVQLGWLIDPIAHSVEIYRPGPRPEILDNPHDGFPAKVRSKASSWTSAKSSNYLPASSSTLGFLGGGIASPRFIDPPPSLT